MDKPVFLSVVVPVYGCRTLLPELFLRLKTAVEPISKDFELILVDDAGPDDAWSQIVEMANKDSRVKGLRLSRNFGQHYAITAGLEASKGEWVVVMDCDLQDLPEEIPNLLKKAGEGYQVVKARRATRKDGQIKKWLSRGFYRVLGYLTGTHHDPAVANFGVYHRQVIDAVCSMKEHIRFFPTMIKWVGFESTTLDVQHGGREEGKSAYSLRKLLHLALDIMLAYSDKPLRLTIKAGIAISATAFIFALYSAIRAIRGEFEVLGYASLIVSIWFLSGLIIFILGVVGLYVGKTFEGVKNRPVYIVRERTSEEDERV